MAALRPSQAFARSVQRARALRGWNQDQLAKRLTELGVPTQQSTVARIEKEKRGVSLDDAITFAYALGVPLPSMLAGFAVDGEDVALTPKAVEPAWLAHKYLLGHLHRLEGSELFGALSVLPREEREPIERAVAEARRRGQPGFTMPETGEWVRLLDVPTPEDAEGDDTEEASDDAS